MKTTLRFILALVALIIPGAWANSQALPAGCVSSSGYSSTNGLPCNRVLPDGCIQSNGFSTTTGIACNDGCTSDAGYSVTTGFPCNYVAQAPNNFVAEEPTGSWFFLVQGKGGTYVLAGPFKDVKACGSIQKWVKSTGGQFSPCWESASYPIYEE